MNTWWKGPSMEIRTDVEWDGPGWYSPVGGEYWMGAFCLWEVQGSNPNYCPFFDTPKWFGSVEEFWMSVPASSRGLNVAWPFGRSEEHVESRRNLGNNTIRVDGTSYASWGSYQQEIAGNLK